MVHFLRYYKENKLVKVSMEDMEELIENETNRKVIAQYIYLRLYTRFLMIFDFTDELKGQKSAKLESLYRKEYKNGFLMMASGSLLIETFAAFLTGENETPSREHRNRFKKVFDYADSKGNNLKEFIDEPFYGKIRCGILHQGETKGKFLITREGNTLFNKDESKIDATLFIGELKKLLKNYRNDLMDTSTSWNSDLWDSCRQKIRHIISNSQYD